MAADPSVRHTPEPLRHGDRVTITAPGHPWMNHSGVLLAAPPGSLHPWMVEFDHGTRAGVMVTEVSRG